MVESDLVSGPDTLFFLSIMKNRLDTKAKRGAIVKALAIGSKFKLVESYKAMLNNVLDSIFEMEDINRSPDENLKKIKIVIN